MIIYSLSLDGNLLFESKDKEEFLTLCENHYKEVADDTWPTYEDKNELPEIFTSYGYVYDEKDSETGGNTNGKPYTDMVILFNKISVWNPTYTYDNASTLIIVCQRLLIDYNERVLAYLADTSDNASLITYLAGNDGIEQWDFHKSFVSQYGVYIY